MDPPKTGPQISFFEAVVKRKIVQICEHVGYNAISQDSLNILTDLHRQLMYDIAKLCKETANRNRRSEVTMIDFIRAYDIVNLSLPELKEHIDRVKLDFPVEIEQDEPEPSNRVQRNLLVDELLEEEKKEGQTVETEDLELKPPSENGEEEEKKQGLPLLKDTFNELVNQFPDCNPVAADKSLKLSGLSIVIVNNKKLKITSPEIPPQLEPVKSSPKLSSPKTKMRIKTKAQRKEKIPSTEEFKEPENISSELPPLKEPRIKTKVKVKPFTKKRTKVPESPIPAPPTPDKVKVKPLVKKEKDLDSVETAALEPPIPDKVKVKPLLKKEIPIQETSLAVPTRSENVKVKIPLDKKKKKKKKFEISVSSIPAPSAPDPGPSEIPPIFPPAEPGTSQEDLCPECNLPDDGSMMIQCDDPECARWFHGKCVGLLEEPKEDESWFCRACVAKQQSAFYGRRRRAK